ncbi:hypothetical protein PV326_006211 [Microctonus aethiopoides]|nr:hypothetical protein PV326_006211 [Microctonus aethiopoides]
MEVVEVCTEATCCPPPSSQPISTPYPTKPPRMLSYAPKRIHRPPSIPFDANTTYHNSYLNINSQNGRTKCIRPKPVLQTAKEKFESDTTSRSSYQPIWDIVKSKPFIPRRRRFMSQGPMETTTTIRNDFGPKYAPRPEIIVPSGNIRSCSGRMDGRTTTSMSFVHPGFVRPPNSYKPSTKFRPSDEPAAKETTHRLSYQPYLVKQRESNPWAQKPIYKTPDTTMSVKTTYSKSYKKIETPVVKTKAILPTSGAEWFQGNREFNEKSCYTDAFIPQSTEPRKSIPFVPSGNIHLSDKKMSSETTNRLSYQLVHAEKRIPFRPKQRNMMGGGSMESTTTNRSDFQHKITQRPEIIIPCDNIHNSNKPIEGSTTTASSYMNHGVVQPPPSFKPSVSYSRSPSKVDGDTTNKLSYPRWTQPAKEVYPWAKKLEYQRPKERMVGDSMYNMSFAPPGYYIEVDSSDTTQNSDSTIIDTCSNNNCSPAV